MFRCMTCGKRSEDPRAVGDGTSCHQATDVMQVITTRAIQFIFTLRMDPVKTVTLDMVRFPGRTYAQLESMAISAMIADGYGYGDIMTYTHRLVD